jgi:glycosyltransferase involved in cell wall biosynthesis
VDSNILLEEGLNNDIAVIPNIHEMHPLQPQIRSDKLELIFIGSYAHAPNIDAMLYFCQEIMPILRTKVTSLRLRIVGSTPSDEVKALAAADIEVVGFVPETTSYLLSSHISIAPLRYGGGIKGKIGEAQAHGLPVVTTSIGAEGFGFQDGLDVLVGDTPPEFADAIAALWQDPTLNERVRRNGWNFIDQRYSVQAVGNLLPPIFQSLSACSPKRISFITRANFIIRHYLGDYVLWRLKM